MKIILRFVILIFGFLLLSTYNKYEKVYSKDELFELKPGDIIHIDWISDLKMVQVYKNDSIHRVITYVKLDRISLFPNQEPLLYLESIKYIDIP